MILNSVLFTAIREGQGARSKFFGEAHHNPWEANRAWAVAVTRAALLVRWLRPPVRHVGEDPAQPHFCNPSVVFAVDRFRKRVGVLTAEANLVLSYVRVD